MARSMPARTRDQTRHRARVEHPEQVRIARPTVGAAAAAQTALSGRMDAAQQLRSEPRDQTGADVETARTRRVWPAADAWPERRGLARRGSGAAKGSRPGKR